MKVAALFVSAFSCHLRRAPCRGLCVSFVRPQAYSSVPNWAARTSLRSRSPAFQHPSSNQFDHHRHFFTIRALEEPPSSQKGRTRDGVAAAGATPQRRAAGKQATGKPGAPGNQRAFLTTRPTSSPAESSGPAQPPVKASAKSRSSNAKYDPPPLDERDLEESFVKGSGAGGQKINKTSSCVVLRHIPSGVTVRCQESRSQSRNRTIARKILQKKLDEIERGEESLIAQEASKARARKRQRRRKSVKKHFKTRRDQQMMDDRM